MLSITLLINMDEEIPFMIHSILQILGVFGSVILCIVCLYKKEKKEEDIINNI